MKQYRFSFQWFTPEKVPTTCWEFSVDSYNSFNAIERALQKVKDSGRNILVDMASNECIMNFWEVK